MTQSKPGELLVDFLYSPKRRTHLSLCELVTATEIRAGVCKQRLNFLHKGGDGLVCDLGSRSLALRRVEGKQLAVELGDEGVYK